jgi:4-diphosphocytidyl-2-C-methyl-D-erythritol kinase
MILFPNCKINLGLSITAKRADGFHELETVFYPVALQDIVEIIPAPNANTPVAFSSTGIPVPGTLDDNLCVKAYALLKKDFPSIPAIQMHLHKHIPMGAGLGGGSSDATAVLQILNQQFNLQISSTELIRYAALLGSDCPFFVWNTPAHATGRGEILTPIPCDLSNYTIVLLHPGVHISTAWAFQQLTPHKKAISIQEIIAQPISNWKQNLVNDFEAPIFSAHPLLASLKNDLYEQGAVYASMSGSGSSLFGIFKQKPTLIPPPSCPNLRIDII